MDLRKRSTGSLIIAYAAIAVLFIAAFQSYWLAEVYNDQKRQVLKDTEGILNSNMLSYDAFTTLQNMYPNAILTAPSVMRMLASTGMTTSIGNKYTKDGTTKYIDSLYASDIIERTSISIMKDIRDEVEHKYPGLDFVLAYTIKGKVVRMPNNKATAPYATQKVFSKLNDKMYYRIGFFNLPSVVLRKMLFPVLLSGVYLLVCVSAVILLVTTIRKSRKLMEMKDNFTHNMTHELKTPLATLLVATEALDKYNVLDDKPAAREYVQIMHADLKRLAQMAENILHNARLSDGKINLAIRPVNLGGLLAEIAAKFRLRIEKDGAAISIDKTLDTITVDGDGEHLGNVFTNLVDNALKYSQDKPRISITGTTDGTMATLLFTDNGAGIPEEHQKDIFKPYFRVSEGDTHEVKGYGLGLSYSQGIIKLHKGSIRVLRSSPGQGTTFEVIIPHKYEGA